MQTLIYNGQIIIDGERRIDNGAILFDDKIIIDVCENYDRYLANPNIEKINANDMWVTPGFVDNHTHGAVNYDFNDADSDAINTIGKYLVEEGITGFLATTTVESIERTREIVKTIGSYKYEDGARCLGIHMETPFLNEVYFSDHPIQYFRDADINEYREWQAVSNNFVKILTLAPERNKSMEFIKTLKDEVVISIGHSDATIEQIQIAKESGAKAFTHLYNAMSQHLHRKPGVVTSAFLEDELYCELITDGMHIDIDVLRMTIKHMGVKRIILITDSMMGKGMPDGRYFLCGNWVIKEKNKTYKEGDISIAGSIMPLNEMCKSIMNWCNLSINEIVQMACVNPNKLVNRVEKGSLEVGKDADIVIFNKDMKPLKVFVEGNRKK